MNNLATSSQEPEEVGFDYSKLAADQANFLRVSAEEIKTKRESLVADMLRIGELLQKARETLGYGKFGPWRDAATGLHERTAQRFMNIYKFLGKEADTVSALDASTIYLLAEPSFPEGLREDILAGIRTGDMPTHEEVEARLDHHKAVQKPSAAKPMRASGRRSTKSAVKMHSGDYALDDDQRILGESSEFDDSLHKENRTDEAVATIIEAVGDLSPKLLVCVERSDPLYLHARLLCELRIATSVLQTTEGQLPSYDVVKH